MLETERLILRRWQPRDRAPFAALNADPEVMRYFPKRLTRTESDGLIARLEDRWAEDGIGFAAAERKADGVFLGMVGLARVRFAESLSPLAGAVEVGWRLARAHWGRGYATEAARGWIGHGLGTMGLDEIIAFTVPANTTSLAVMHRLGMRLDPTRSFDHPLLPEGHALRPHLVFALRAESADT